MAATVSLAKPAARAATARSRRAARTSSLSERVSGKGMAIAAPLREGSCSIRHDTTTPNTIQGHLLPYFVAEVIPQALLADQPFGVDESFLDLRFRQPHRGSPEAEVPYLPP